MEKPKSPNVYARAAELLRRDGWCQGFNSHPDGRRCLIGALDNACIIQGVAFDGGARERAKAKLGLLPRGSLAEWNDAPGRTLPEVLAVLDELAGEG